VIVEETEAPAVSAPALAPAVPRDLCTDCGISRTADHKRCGRACQFIKPNYPQMEARVHGRTRNPHKPDEIFFGPFRKMVRAAMREPREGAQWTGITTRIGERLLETGAVDAVLTMAPDPNDKWRPMPVIITKPEGMAQARGMRARAAGARAEARLQAARDYRYSMPSLRAAVPGEGTRP